jgi:metal-responsive CopG/Arc/MetJ family transcriptional regulator
MPTIKTAISIEKNLFDKINRLSDEIKLSRSQIFSQAVRYFIERKNNLELVRRINRAYSDILDENEIALLEKSRRKHRKIIEEWQ